MAAEIEKLAMRLKDGGYPAGGNLLYDFANSLLDAKLIPEHLPQPSGILDQEVVYPTEVDMFMPQGSYGDQLRAYRKRLGMSLRSVSEKSGIFHSTIMRYELGRVSVPRANSLLALSDAYDLNEPQSIALFTAAGLPEMRKRTKE